MPFLQELIHKFELGSGLRTVRIALAVIAALFLAVVYDVRAFRNMATQEAMDAAQLGRNIAEGKGYTTLFVRSFSVFLVKRHNQKGHELASPPSAAQPDPARLKQMHPDLANPPVYPVVLAALIKVLPFDFAVSTSKAFWSTDGRFLRYQPDFLIALFNQLLFACVAYLVFLLARRLFDSAVAWLSLILLLGTEVFWRFTVSGLSTMLLLLIFVGLVWSVVLLEQEAREPKRGTGALFAMAALTGVLVGLGALTRYSFGWLILPLLLFLLAFTGQRRVLLTLAAFLAFAVVTAPWIARNYSVSGTPFGTAGYAVLENTFFFPEHRLARSLNPNLSHPILMAYWLKLSINASKMLQGELPRLGGTWISAFFLVGLLVGFRNPATRRLRYFVLGCCAVLFIAQALGQTQLTQDSPEVNSENLLVLLAPLVLVYGVGLFFLLLEQMTLPARQLRYTVIVGFTILACSPLVLALLPPKSSPIAYPPYFPPSIQRVTGWVKDKELIMSDIPWAVAWYGRRQSVWLTLQVEPNPNNSGPQEDFFAINDFLKPVQALYLTPRTLDNHFLSNFFQAEDEGWGRFILDTYTTQKLPEQFPLRKAPKGFFPNQLVLMDWERWK